MNWKITEKTLLKSRFFKLKEQKIAKGNVERKQEIIERKPISMIFPLNENREIYLISQYRTLYDKVILEAVAGHLDDGESSLVAAKRELEEEAGLIAGQWEEILKIETSGSVIRSRAHFFLAREIEQVDAHPEEDEEITVIKMSFSEAIKKIESGEITNGPTITGLLFLDKLIREKKL
jgi:ADP-ribose pyrophosphatase